MEILCCQWFSFELPIGWSELGVIITAIALLVSVVFSALNWYIIVSQKRARLIYSIEKINKAFCLKVENIGLKDATNVKFSVNEELLKMIPTQGFRDSLLSVSNSKWIMKPNQPKWFYLCPAYDANKTLTNSEDGATVIVNESELERFLASKISIKGSYKSGIWRKCINEKFRPDQFITPSIVPPSLEK